MLLVRHHLSHCTLALLTTISMSSINLLITRTVTPANKLK